MRMIQQDANQLATGITGTSCYANPVFFSFNLIAGFIDFMEDGCLVAKIFANPFTSSPVHPLFISP